MLASTDFDKIFLHLPPFNRETDFINFWKNSINDQKMIPIEPKQVLNKKRSTSSFDCYDISYKGFNKSAASAKLFLPKKVRKPKVIILVHDYNKDVAYPNTLFDNSFAYLTIKLRGHELIKRAETEESEIPVTPGYMVENILDNENYYVKGIYLDVYRSIDALRLNNKIDCSSVGIIGKGLGSAAAVFAAAFSERVTALVLETPSFCYLPLIQNLSTSDAAREINNFILAHRTKKSLVKKNLTYYDALNFADMISCPVLATVGLRDTISPPECVFALFNHLLTDKTIEVYPDEDNIAGGKKQFSKSLLWLKKQLLVK